MGTLKNSVGRFWQQNVVVVDVIGLVLAALVVHILYVLYVDPAAADVLQIAQSSGAVPERTFSIVIKDLEQEICFILALWCMWLWAFRYRLFTDESYLLETDFLELENLENYDHSTLDELERRLDGVVVALPNSTLLSCVAIAFTNLRHSVDFKAANDAAMDACELHLEVMNSKLSITKYILWAIPSVGFLGTVRGIGQALGQAGEAMGGDITGVASSLGVAFNSTFVALFLSLVLMFISYVLQGREEKLIASTKRFISVRMIPKLGTLARQTNTVPT